MNNVNIYTEYLQLRVRRNLSDTDISIATGISRQAIRKWTGLDDKYIYKIANYCGDDRFVLATFCYYNDLPSVFLNVLNRYNDDQLSLLLGTQQEDKDSDSAISDLLQQLSRKIPDVAKETQDVKEILETGIFMILYSLKTIREKNLPLTQIIKWETKSNGNKK